MFRWIVDILKFGLKKPIVEDDIYSCPKNHKSKENSEIFKKLWSKELKKEKPKLVKSIVKFCALKIFLIGIPITVMELMCK